LGQDQQQGAGPLELFLDRIKAVGHLPSRAKDIAAIQKLLLNDELRIDDMVDQLIKDPALAWELLRVVNSARYQSGIDDTSCSLGRAVVLLGEQGLKRVSGGLRAWPGVLADTASLISQEASERAINALEAAMKRACIAAMAARWLRPFNIGDEEAMIAAMSQHLGPLLILYHFPEESAQIHNLMQPAPPTEPEGKPTPGMTLEAATGAVLGISPTELTEAVLKFWGFPDSLVQAAHPLSPNVSPRKPESTEDWLRITACLANELCGLIGQPSARQGLMMTQILSRYARPALTSQKELIEALQRAVMAVDRALYRKMFPPQAEGSASASGPSRTAQS
jgi:HD-like signal output (HDOD) protein